MHRLIAMILLISSPAVAQNGEAFKDCKPIGATAKGEMVYGLDCKAVKAENLSNDVKPNMPETNLKETVIPKAGATQTPETTPTTGVNK